MNSIRSRRHYRVCILSTPLWAYSEQQYFRIFHFLFGCTAFVGLPSFSSVIYNNPTSQRCPIQFRFFFVVFVPVVFVVAQQSIQLIWFGVGRLFWQPSQADRIGFGKRHGSMLHLLPSLSTPTLYITQTHIAHTAHTCTEETAVSNWILCFSAIFFFDSVSHKFVQRRMLHCEVVDGRRWYTCTLWASFCCCFSSIDTFCRCLTNEFCTPVGSRPVGHRAIRIRGCPGDHRILHKINRSAPHEYVVFCVRTPNSFVGCISFGCLLETAFWSVVAAFIENVSMGATERRKQTNSFGARVRPWRTDLIENDRIWCVFSVPMCDMLGSMLDKLPRIPRRVFYFQYWIIFLFSCLPTGRSI